MTIVGVCKLCRHESELQNSHLIPKAVYRFLRSSEPGFNDPTVNLPNGRVLTSKQIRQPLLCKECEGRFSNRGENIVIPLINKSDTEFELRSQLLREELTVIYQKGNFYCLKLHKTTRIPVEALKYFAASVFWRASVAQWNIGKVALPRISLENLEEDFRLYLLGDKEFPTGIDLLIECSSEIERIRSMVVPQPFAHPPRRAFFFRVPGVLFMLHVGIGMPKVLAPACLNALDGPGLLYLPFQDSPVIQMAKRLVDSLPNLGKLGEEGAR